MGTTKKTTRATAPERTDERGGWRRAEVATIVHEVRRHMGRGPVHSITVDLWVTGMSCKSRKFVLDGASAVAEVRAFFALFDFPLTKAEELDAACERASAGELWVQNGRPPRPRHGASLFFFAFPSAWSPWGVERDGWTPGFGISVLDCPHRFACPSMVQRI